MRRMRADKFSRELMQEHVLTAMDLIYPMFVIEGDSAREPVDSMPGVERVSINELEKEAEEIYEHLKSVMSKFLTYDIDYFGYMLYDSVVPESVRKQKPFYERAPHSKATECIDRLAEKLIGGATERHSGSSAVYNFFKRLFQAK